ncbi:MAG: hypothetical protein J0653_00750, partial [Deltaproteobacteria bacterium]|nr:hypothetical protein [Deltaproteobacteria bacterium]
MKNTISKIGLLALMLSATVASGAATLTKDPDLGGYWSPLSSQGTYTYANSFVAPTSGKVSAMGTWLSGGSSDLQFKIFESIAGDVQSGPDAGAVLASSGTLIGNNYASLSFVGVSESITSGVLLAGHTYWFAVTTVGLGGVGRYTVGAHTPNSSGITDNGTLWYSNAADGIVFDGSQERPELAFSVSIS